MDAAGEREDAVERERENEDDDEGEEEEREDERLRLALDLPVGAERLYLLTVSAHYAELDEQRTAHAMLTACRDELEVGSLPPSSTRKGPSASFQHSEMPLSGLAQRRSELDVLLSPRGIAERGPGSPCPKSQV